MSELLPLFPLGTVLFPGALLPLHIFEPRYIEMTRDALDGDRLIALAQIRSGAESPEPDPRRSIR